MRNAVISVAMLLLSGCAHTMDITSERTGAVAELKIPEGPGNGEIDFALDGKPYHGTWIYAPYNENLWFASETEANETGFGSPWGGVSPSGGSGDLVAVTPGGPNLDCRFDVSAWNGRGFGRCLDGDGKAYDVQIH